MLIVGNFNVIAAYKILRVFVLHITTCFYDQFVRIPFIMEYNLGNL